jgi:hypothetical protein
MNKAALGTILGTAVLGLAKSKGSRSNDAPTESTAEFINGDLYLYGKPYTEFHPYLEELQAQIKSLLDAIQAVGINTLDKTVNGKHINKLLLEDYPDILDQTGFKLHNKDSRFFARRLQPVNLEYYQKHIPNISDDFGIIIGDSGEWSGAKVGPGDQELKSRLTLGINFLEKSDLDKDATLAHEIYHILDSFDDSIATDETAGKNRKELFIYLSSPNEIKAFARQLALCLSRVAPEVKGFSTSQELFEVGQDKFNLCGVHTFLLVFQKIPAPKLIERLKITQPNRVKNMENAAELFRQYLNYFLKVYHNE